MNEAKCVNCGKSLQTTQFIDGEIRSRLTPDYAETQYTLSDGSKMRVAMCKKCVSGKVDTKTVMSNVEHEWDADLAEKYPGRELPKCEKLSIKEKPSLKPVKTELKKEK